MNPYTLGAFKPIEKEGNNGEVGIPELTAEDCNDLSWPEQDFRK
jgi:hypothetical protein